ncbi:hypothetical protein CBR_g53677 [Chara braunii]|uniref:GOLD domain-containing protein n=1 Tax=Chara braunii TaxID=69332 RepID=A0A388MB45_CHABU|nr:hypothetical protein CBR_g53677 [Chara braunii]|eukprot:GBG91788.1 hypothetical protein CBR_g53677 [Chara braunii]
MASASSAILWAALFTLAVLVFHAEGLRFDLIGPHAKCIGEEIQKNVLVVGDYQVIGVTGGDPSVNKVSVKVTSPYGEQLHLQESVERGQFGYTTKESGNYAVCFWQPDSRTTATLTIDLDWKQGVFAKDWEQFAKKEKLDTLELELRKLEEQAQAIHDEMLYMKERESEMRDLNELTNSRVAWFSISSLFICLAVAGWQLYHLKSYFERKKLL